jgi:SAM-dependent methyltransferase
VEVYDNQTIVEWEASQNDLPFYLEEAKVAGGALLELGCGTGRLLIPLLSSGLDVSGLDASGDLQKRILTARWYVRKNTSSKCVGRFVMKCATWSKAAVSWWRPNTQIFTVPLPNMARNRS